MSRVISKVILIATISALFVSCSSAPQRQESPEKIVDAAMGRSNVTPAKVSTLPVADRSDLPYIPIVTPPEVIRVWIYDHVTPSNDLVMGHWIYVKIAEQDWYIKNNFHTQSPQQKIPLPPRSPEPEQQTQNIPTTPSAPASSDQQLKALLSTAGLGK